VDKTFGWRYERLSEKHIRTLGNVEWLFLPDYRNCSGGGLVFCCGNAYKKAGSERDVMVQQLAGWQN